MPAFDLRLPSRHAITNSVLTALLALGGGNTAHAAVVIGDANLGLHAELVLYMWDPVTESSYSKDLGLVVYGDQIQAGDPAKNLFVFGQQDAGYQKLWAPLNSDPFFTQFLARSTNKDNQHWAIFAVAENSALNSEPGWQSVYTTLMHTTPSGTTNPEYTKLLGMSNNAGLQSMRSRYFDANDQQKGTANATNGLNTNHDTVDNGSGFFVKGNNLYVSSWFPFGPSTAPDSDTPPPFNKVGTSSWFYHVQTSATDGDAKVLVDEFDNKTHDAFWGLGIDSSGNYILSYTLPGATIQAQASTEAGRARQSFTDFSAQAGGARLLGLADDTSFSLSSQVSAVPEPESWGLMALGVAVLSLARRRATRPAQSA